MTKISWSDVSLTVWSIAVFAFLFAPIIVIIASSFNVGRLLVSWDAFGFDSFLALVEKPAIRDAVLDLDPDRRDRRGGGDAHRHAGGHRDGAAPGQVGVLVHRTAAARARSRPRSSTPWRCCRGSCSSARTSA